MSIYERLGYFQSVPLEWLQAPEEGDRASLLEFVRGTLYSLSNREEGRFEAVHASRIQRAFKKLGAPSQYKVGLRLLDLLREAEPLFGGYWLPTPFRVVEIEGEFAFVGALPTAFGFLGEVQGHGISRLLTKEVADRFPRQSLESWMGTSNHHSASIVADFTAKHVRSATRTANLPDVECLSLASSRAGRDPQLQWGNKLIPTLPAEQIAVCRQLSRGRARYFSADLIGGRVSTEAPIDMAISRLLFAIARHIGAPVKVEIGPGSDWTRITVYERLPIEEFRLALLLSKEVIRAGRSTTFVIPSKFAPALGTRLATLGCAVEILK
jgi:hypothetical protein